MNIGETFLSKSISNHLPIIRLGNFYEEDISLQSYLKFYLGSSLNQVESDLKTTGAKSSCLYHKNGVLAEQNPPKHLKYDAYGRKVDELILHEGWNNMKGFSAEEGLISIPYTINIDNARVYQTAKLYMFGSNSGLFNCPLAMTDGAAFLISQLKKHSPSDITSELENALTHLISKDKNEFWTSGQWMTEKDGGSDVTKSTQTVAVKVDNNMYKLYGYKWFSSATDADMTFALAKIIPDNVNDVSNVDLNTIKPSLFFVKVRDIDNNLNGIEIVRLKEKLGTRQLPTAELILKGTKAQLVGKQQQGIKIISHMLNITRLHNSIAAVSGMRKITNIVLDYSNRREAFGRLIKDHPLHHKINRELEFNTRGNLLFVLEISSLLDKADKNTQSHNDVLLLRSLTPILKLFTAKEAIKWIGEGIEALGALGYLEDSHVPHILRDAYVLSIWEGTTNVLSHDFLRSINPENIKILHNWIFGKCTITKAIINTLLDQMITVFTNPRKIEINARNLSINYSLIIIVVLLDNFVRQFSNEENMAVLNHWKKRLSREVVIDNVFDEIETKTFNKLISNNFGRDVDQNDIERPKL